MKSFFRLPVVFLLEVEMRKLKRILKPAEKGNSPDHIQL